MIEGIAGSPHVTFYVDTGEREGGIGNESYGTVRFSTPEGAMLAGSGVCLPSQGPGEAAAVQTTQSLTSEVLESL